MMEGAAKFDWYEGTIYEQAYDDVAFELGKALSPLFELKPSRPATNYHHGASIIVNGRPVVDLSHGGNPGTHFKVTGQDAEEITPIIRDLFLHEVSRVDVAIDYHSPTVFEAMSEELIDFAKPRELSLAMFGDWHYGGKKGRTLNVGSRSSPAFARLYEKGKKEGASPNWVRLELENKPKGTRNRELASRLSPEEILASASRWSNDLASILMDHQCEVIQKHTRTVTDLEKRTASMFYQYGRTLNEIFDTCTTPEQFGVKILAELKDFERRKRGS